MRLTMTAALVAATLLTNSAHAETLERMAGQMIVVGFTGTSVDDKSVQALVTEIANGGVGGVMYLKTNVKSGDAVRAMNRAFHDASPSLPPFVTLDQEGGSVQRLTKEVGFPDTPNAADVAKTRTPGEARALYDVVAKGVADWGFNVNFAPVVDLASNPDNPIIARFGRAFSAAPGKVVDYAEQVIDAHHAAGIITAIKHFPGHGSSTGDSHKGFVDITKTWRENELDPYRKLIKAGYADMVMVGHLTDTKVDPSGRPASLSAPWIEGKLRKALGYQGVVVSDDMQMGAIRDQYGFEDAIVDAVNAGVDVLLFSNTVEPRNSLADEIRAILVKHAEADPAFAARIAESYARIVALKARIGHPASAG